MGELPIDFKGWGVHVGDSILLTESNAPDSGYTLINIVDKKNPVLIGYQKTKYNTITKFEKEDTAGYSPIKRFYYSTNTNKLITRDSLGGVVNLFEYNNGIFEFKDSMNISCNSLPGFLNDSSIIIIRSSVQSHRMGHFSYF